MEIQANSPFAICSLGALATLRMIIDSFVTLISRDDLDKGTVNMLSQSLCLPNLSLGKVLQGEIGSELNSTLTLNFLPANKVFAVRRKPFAI